MSPFCLLAALLAWSLLWAQAPGEPQADAPPQVPEQQASETTMDLPACRRLWKNVHVQLDYGDSLGLGRQAFHFTIDDGSEGPDGEVTTCWRWREQMDGVYSTDDALNTWGVGILLLRADESRTEPTAEQKASLTRLLAWLSKEYGVDVTNPLVQVPPAAEPGTETAVQPEPGTEPWARRGVRTWRYIVIHHSATAVGSAAEFDRYHKSKGWGGLGYHFVVGNGNGSGDGQLEVGYRWSDQLTGAHAKNRLFNEYGIGICLVGNFQETDPSPAQVRTTRALVAALQEAYGIPNARVYRHRDVREGITECPGNKCPLSLFLDETRDE